MIFLDSFGKLVGEAEYIPSESRLVVMAYEEYKKMVDEIDKLTKYHNRALEVISRLYEEQIV